MAPTPGYVGSQAMSKYRPKIHVVGARSRALPLVTGTLCGVAARVGERVVKHAAHATCRRCLALAAQPFEAFNKLPSYRQRLIRHLTMPKR